MYSLHMQLKQRYSFLQFYRLLEEVRKRPCKCNLIHTPLTLIYVFIMDITDNLKDISLDFTKRYICLLVDRDYLMFCLIYCSASTHVNQTMNLNIKKNDFVLHLN